MEVEDEESDGWANCVGALRAVYVMFGKYTGKLKVTIRLEVIQKVACEPQTHFRSSLLSLRKIASANPSDKTISVT